MSHRPFEPDPDNTGGGKQRMVFKLDDIKEFKQISPRLGYCSFCDKKMNLTGLVLTVYNQEYFICETCRRTIQYYLTTHINNK